MSSDPLHNHGAGASKMAEPRGDENARWHLDKRVPISIIATMVLQAALGVWFVSKLESRVVALETARAEQRVEQRERDDRQDKAVGEAVGLVRADVKEIGGKIDRLLERARP